MTNQKTPEQYITGYINALEDELNYIDRQIANTSDDPRVLPALAQSQYWRARSIVAEIDFLQNVYGFRGRQ